MRQQSKNSLLAVAIGLGLLSLPMTWMSLRGVQLQGGFGEAFGMFGGMNFDVTGLNGSLTFLVKTPIWFVVLVAVAASVLQLMRGSKIFAIPRAAEWIVASVAVTWVVLALAIAVFSSKATPGIGVLLGLISAAIPLAMLIMPTQAVDSPAMNAD